MCYCALWLKEGKRRQPRGYMIFYLFNFRTIFWSLVGSFPTKGSSKPIWENVKKKKNVNLDFQVVCTKDNTDWGHLPYEKTTKNYFHFPILEFLSTPFAMETLYTYFLLHCNSSLHMAKLTYKNQQFNNSSQGSYLPTCQPFYL